MTTTAETVRMSVVHTTTELIRIRAELEAVCRHARRTHVLAGATPDSYREGDFFTAICLASDAVSEATAIAGRFLDLQVIGLRDALATIDELEAELVAEEIARAA